MPAESTAQQNRPAVLSPDLNSEIAPQIIPSTPWRVKQVEALSGFRHRVAFADGLTGEVDLANLIHSPSAGVFASLAAPKLFEQVSIEYGAVTWPGELDLAPDAMYAKIKESSKWTL